MGLHEINKWINFWNTFPQATSSARVVMSKFLWATLVVFKYICAPSYQNVSDKIFATLLTLFNGILLIYPLGIASYWYFVMNAPTWESSTTELQPNLFIHPSPSEPHIFFIMNNNYKSSSYPIRGQYFLSSEFRYTYRCVL